LLTFFRRLLWLGLFGVSLGVAGAIGIYLYMTPQLPDVDQLKDVRLQTPLRIYSEDSKLIGEYGDKKRTPIDIKKAPDLFVKAILAAEDDRFYEHPGVDIKGLMRAATKLLQSGRIQGGGSTITMQVARNYLLTLDQTFTRKFKEILLSLQMEKELSKDEILELYVNKIFLGKRAYGFEAAAQVYYGVSLDELSLAQWAMLAGLPKAPSSLNPITNPARALIRRDWILDRMLSLGYIGDDEHKEAKLAPITAKNHGITLDLYAPYVAEMVRAEMVERYGRDEAYNSGYRVFTTIDSNLQLAAQTAVERGLLEYDERHGYRGAEANLLEHQQSEDSDTSSQAASKLAWRKQLSEVDVVGGLVPAVVVAITEKEMMVMIASGEQIVLPWSDLKRWRKYINEDRRARMMEQVSDLFNVGDLVRLQLHEGGYRLSQIPEVQAAIVSVDPSNGAIRALIGGYSYAHSKYNRVTQAARQPGSSFKPFVYLRAIEEGYSPATLINDSPVVFADASLESIWRPENDGGKFLGPIRMRQALYQSRNLVSIRMMRALSPNQVIKGLNRFGFDEDAMPRDLSLALGSHAMTPLAMVGGYTLLANGGYGVDSHVIARIETAQGEIVDDLSGRKICNDFDMDTDVEEAVDLTALLAESDSDRCAEQVIDPRVAYLVDDMLKDVITRGTGKKARVLNRNDLAGKTGTTNGPRDAWFSGYSYGNLVTTAWVGFDANTKLGRREYGGSAALPIWINFMQVALEGVEEKPRMQPEGLVQIRIDPKTGRRVSGGVEGVFEYFREEFAPVEEIGEPEIEDPFITDETLEELF